MPNFAHIVTDCYAKKAPPVETSGGSDPIPYDIFISRIQNKHTVFLFKLILSPFPTLSPFLPWFSPALLQISPPCVSYCLPWASLLPACWHPFPLPASLPSSLARGGPFSLPPCLLPSLPAICPPWGSLLPVVGMAALLPASLPAGPCSLPACLPWPWPSLPALPALIPCPLPALPASLPAVYDQQPQTINGRQSEGYTVAEPTAPAATPGQNTPAHPRASKAVAILWFFF